MNNFKVSFTKSIRKKFYVAALYFLIGIFIGAFLTYYVTDGFTYIPNLSENSQNSSLWGDFLSIGKKPNIFNLYMTNGIVCIILAAGIITLGILSRIILLINGTVIGIIIFSYIPLGNSILIPIAVLLPHAIFEIPALLLSASIGMQKITNISKLSFQIILRITAVILILLLLAALAETFVSVKIADTIIH